MNGPVQTEIALSPQVDGPVRLAVGLQPPVPESALNRLAAAIEDFLRLASLGAYVVEALSPVASTVQVLTRNVGHVGVTCDVHAVGIDARIAQVLRNSLVAFGRLNHPVAVVSLRGVDSVSVPTVELVPLGMAPLDRTYPPPSRHLGFDVTHARALGLRSPRRVEVAFRRALNDANLKGIIERFELWARVSFAAYASNEADLQTGECAIFDALPDIMDDSTVEMPIDKFGAPELAWSSLLNLCGRCSRDICEIVSVRIE